MSSPHLVVVDPSVQSAEDACVAAVLDGWSGTATTCRPVLEPGSGPAGLSLAEVDGVVLLGSAASVNESHGWMDELAAWIEPLLSGEVVRPLLGICFGHQLVAHLAGGRVGLAASGVKKEGVEMVEVSGSALLPDRERLPSVVSHYEAVLEPPPGYRTVAVRDGQPHDALEHETLPIYTFQCHPEARAAFLEERGLPSEAVDEELIGACTELLAAFRGLVQARSIECRSR